MGGLKTSLILAIATLVMGSSASVKAIEVQVKPESPRLGDTISIIIQMDQPGEDPIISITRENDSETEEYQAFPLNSSGLRYRALLPTTPLDESGKLIVRVSGDGTTRNIAIWLGDRSFPTQQITLSPDKSSLQATELELNRVNELKNLVTSEKYWDGPFMQPNAGRISSVFGVRRYYNGVFATDYYHRGVDYAGGYGSRVIAPAGGIVRLVGLESKGFQVHGNTVGIDHGQGVVSIFLHLNSIDVQEGDVVAAGTPIGTVGSTGSSTGPHLHWGLYVNGKSVDPVPWRFEGIE
ncbi:MAG: M23 family metallopeptidase [Gomphosphaeria aponina SAG 52.96 = DSM 107014]|uniref:M23 family metallopeptidase n=1 Tax=Gomphosphaeria aponina SAG 52.96 = DSM 107014 TaxID=1521640 RepID=A0A941JPZ4_9CHRO|nr:M23 family metallopeptidase [Gomphosphaeria aponina SAG 52.96 = DSM 107014]